jgi:hypothetical protein
MKLPDCPVCRTCRGPVQHGFARCYQCELAYSDAAPLLADVVVPLGYAIKGGQLAGDLRRYKSERDVAGTAGEAGERLRSTLLTFLRDHGACVWLAAGMPGAPGAVAVVPSGQGRPGRHPLTAIVGTCVELPSIELSVVPALTGHTRGVSVGWLRVSSRVRAHSVLVVDDTWVSGGSAQSAAAALKLAGAARVAVVVLGRHLDPADPRSAGLIQALRSAPGGGSCGLGDCAPRAWPGG